MKKIIYGFAFFIGILYAGTSFAQYQSFKLNPNKDTINRVTKSGVKEGEWVISVPELRGEPGYEEEGIFKKGIKEGIWRKYSSQGDLLAVESYFNGGKDGLQQYFNFIGGLEREESWKGYNPDAPYDTIAIYGTGSNEIVDFRIVKAEQYSVKDGEWKYYDPNTGELLRTENWRLNVIVKAQKGSVSPTVAAEPPKKGVEKTAQMLEWEKKNKGKKGAIRSGETGL
jgi:hypothetical protein